MEFVMYTLKYDLYLIKWICKKITVFIQMLKKKKKSL